MKVALQITGSGIPSQGIQYNPSSLINLYQSSGFGIDQTKSTNALFKTPGSSFYIGVTAGIFQGWTVANNLLYAVIGGTLYSINEKVATSLGTISDTSNLVSLVSNNTQLMIGTLSGGYYYTYATNTLASITDVNYLGTNYITYHRDRVVYAQPGTNLVWVGTLDNFSVYDATLFQSAELLSGNVVSAFATPTDLLVFGQYQTNVWLVTTNLNYPYIPNTSVAIPYGLAAKFSPVNINQNIFYLAQDQQGLPLVLTISTYNSYIPQIVSDEAMCYQLQQLSTVSDAIGTEIQFNGHMFYCLIFPTVNKSFLYDLASKKWTQWKSWHNDGQDINGNTIYSLGRHLTASAISYQNNLLIADYRNNGAILKLSTTTFTDYFSGSQNSIYCEVVLPVLYNLGNRQTINSLEMDCEKGDDVYSDLNYSKNPLLNQPLFTVSLSKDGGRTYSYTRQVPIPTSGNYYPRIITYKWGNCRNGVFKLSIDHPTFVGIYNIWVDLDVENTNRFVGMPTGTSP